MRSHNSKENGTLALAAGLPLVALLLFAQTPSTWPPGHWSVFVPDQERAGDFFSLVLMLLAFAVFRARFWSGDVREARSFRNAIVLMVAQALCLRASQELLDRNGLGISGLGAEVWIWNPWFLTTGLAVILLGARWGVVLSLSGAFFLQLFRDPGSLPLVGSLLACFAAVLLLRRSPTRARVLRAGAGAGVLLTGVAVAELILTGGFAEISSMELVPLMAPLLVGLLSAFAVLALLPLVEWVTGELSDVTLTECGSDHPLLDELREKAPGTWHHTLNVADLSRRAAAAIRARALYCYTAALFHDIGKLKDPSVFAENISGVSPHDTLDPRESAQRIIEHVPFGLELARKYRLPRPFREIIAEHHGLSLVRFFYAKAQEDLREGETADSLVEAFRYPGPPPSSRESGIIALADTVEAATRSCGHLPEHELQAFVRTLVAQRISEGELGQCPLSLAELDQVQRVFLTWLNARQHHRPAYPRTRALVMEESPVDVT
jgi:cyclic-di-AMP phosphodiesterase PgpH